MQVQIYADAIGYEPFQTWIDQLRDAQGRRRIIARLQRLKQGNPGDVSPIGEGLSELRLDFGPGYRVYFGKHAVDIILILCGGDKSSQKQDISKAKDYWKQVRHG